MEVEPQIGRIARIGRIMSSGMLVWRHWIAKISAISQISVISVLLPCAVRGNTDWTDYEQWHA